MTISLRSYLTAGTVAVVGAGAIALAPLPGVAAPAVSLQLPTVAAEVSLASIQISDILGVITDSVTGALPTIIGNLLPGLGGFATALVPAVIDLLPAVIQLLPTTFFVDIATAVVNQAGPIVIGAARDTLTFVGQTANALFLGPNSIPAVFYAATIGVPAALITAVGQLASGDVAGAIQTAIGAFTGPVNQVKDLVTTVIGQFTTFASSQAAGLLSQVPGIVLGALQTAVSKNVAALTTVVQTVIRTLVPGLPGAAVAPPSAARVTAASAAAVAKPASAKTANSKARSGQGCEAGRSESRRQGDS